MRKKFGFNTFLFFIIIGLNVLCFQSAYAQESKIKDTIDTFYDSVEQGDRASLLSTIAPSVVAKIKQDPSKAGVLGMVYNYADAVKQGKIKISFRNRNIDVKLSNQASAAAEVNLVFVVEVIQKNKVRERRSNERFKLVLNKGRWLITDLEMIKK